MERVIQKKRRMELDVTGAVRGTFVYDGCGCCLHSCLAAPLTRKQQEGLEALVGQQPSTSGRETRTVFWEGAPVQVNIHRYIGMTLGDLADLQAERIPDREAVVDTVAQRTLTYRDLKEISDSLAKGLLSLGIRKGDHVAVLLDNSWENIVAKIAAAKVGAVVVNLNIHEKSAMMETLLANAEVRAVIFRQKMKRQDYLELFYEMDPELVQMKADGLSLERLPRLKALIAVDQTGEASCTWRWEQLLEAGRSLPDQALSARRSMVRPTDDASIIHTSGTSGVPKGVLLTHAQLMENAWNHRQSLNLTGEERFCMTPPMFHALGCVGSVITMMVAGGTLVCFGSSSNEELYQVLLRERCTVLCSVPTIFVRLVELVKSRGGLPEGWKLRLCITAGAPCGTQTLADMKQVLGARHVVVMYGMTEAGPGIAGTAPGDFLEILTGTVGRFWPGVQGQIRSLEDGHVLGPGQKGEICVKSYSVMREYYRNPEETRKAVDAEGWLHTGDIGSLSADGYLSLHGRCKDLIIRGGENISSREIEEFLRTNDTVEDAAVVGAPDTEYGEAIYAFVIAEKGSRVSEALLKDWCRGRIATIKIPQRILVVEAFPATATGKTAKGELRRMAARMAAEQGSQ